ncbi:MAG: response regulator [Candidatus Omnitrophica bacterium]|nr:response regulator [Candidatus Omnitrophota bacterium]
MSKKILLIEDEMDQITMVSVRLKANGFKVVFAMDGEEGLKKAAEEKPDLILLDLIIPKIDGFEVSKRLKSEDSTKNIPIIAITAAGIKDIEQKCRVAGMDDFIAKPYDSMELVSKIKSFLEKK